MILMETKKLFLVIYLLSRRRQMHKIIKVIKNQKRV